MKKYKWNGIIWNLAGYGTAGRSALLWRKEFFGHSGNGLAIDRPLNPEAEGHCYWIPVKELETVIQMEENE